MFEYSVPNEHHIKIAQDPAKLFSLTIGLLGDFAAEINRERLSSEVIADLKDNLLFAAHFFDAYLQSKLNETLDPYLALLCSASYYLCDLPGSAKVLTERISNDSQNFSGNGLENLLLWLLKSSQSSHPNITEGPFSTDINLICENYTRFFNKGEDEEILINLINKLRVITYDSDIPRELLLGDVIAAVLRKKINNSSWKALPLYSGISVEEWRRTLQKDTFIKELWPAQHRLGQAEVLKGKSAIIQMPTSTGKTKAIELVLRSAFLSNRTSLAIIIAPFRALCHEIKNDLLTSFQNETINVDELSDALQTDFKIDKLLGRQQILVITPEKFLYVLRHEPKLTSNAKLLVFDEGHQFDSGTRGINYELLLTSLRSMLPKEAQKILISAVISNAEAVGTWLNEDPNVVEGTNLNPSFKSIGFASWPGQLGTIEYVDSQNIERGEFSVPRVIEQFNLGKRGSDKKDLFFPDKSDGKTIALYLGLKLVPEGGVAIFCGLKTTAADICKKAVEIIEGGISLQLPLEFSNQDEVGRLHELHVANLGSDAFASMSAERGIFSHHGNTPQGIRLAIEYAMRNNLVKFVVCTSTLAQGVNLPIRYLIVHSTRQGEEQIKVRDFQNLIGRAGRAGIHTEGSIIFAASDIYDKRKTKKDSWRWKDVKKLLESKNVEPCISNLLSLFEPIVRDNGKDEWNIDALDFTNLYLTSPDEIIDKIVKLAKETRKRGFSEDKTRRQALEKISLISSIESFLLSHWDENNTDFSETDAICLGEGTLAFSLADEKKRQDIRELFSRLTSNISSKISDPNRRRAYGRTLYGVRDAQKIEGWVRKNYAQFLLAKNSNEILNVVWSLLIEHIHSNVFIKFDNLDVKQKITQEWIDGKPFHELLVTINAQNITLIYGKKRKKINIDHVVNVCEGVLAYEGALLIGALCEFVKFINQSKTVELISRLQLFQKQLKYGLPTEAAISLYEMGFSDRVIAQELALAINFSNNNEVKTSAEWGLDSASYSCLIISDTKREKIKQIIKNNKNVAISIMNKYPSYYQKQLDKILQEMID